MSPFALMRVSRAYLGYTSALALFGLATPTFADNASLMQRPTEREAETVIVVGQRDAPITVVPRGLSVSLAQDEFEAINAVNVEDLMKYAPNFFVRKRFAGDDNAVVALRGANTVQSARTIVMVDGFLVSNFLGNSFGFSPKWNVVGPAEVRQFDIVYGPYSARYGGNSMGGIVSVTTEQPKETGAYLTAQSLIMPFKEYGFDETFTGYSVEGGVNWVQKDGPFKLRAGFRRFENTGQSMTYNLLTPAAGTQAATPVTGAFGDSRLATPVFGAASPPDVVQNQFRLRVSADLAQDWRVEGLFFAWNTTQTLTNTRSFLKDVAGNDVGQGRVSFNGQIWNATGLTRSSFKRDEFLAGVKLLGQVGAWDLSLNLSHYWIPLWDTKTSRDFLTGAANGGGTLQVQDNPGWYALDGGIERQFGRHNLAVGLNANRYETAQDTFNTNAWRDASGRAFSSATAGRTETWGIYIEDAIDLNETTTLTLGGRLDYWRAFDGSISRQSGAVRVDQRYASRSDSSFSPKASIQAQLSDDLTLQLSIGSAKRFPTVGELFQGRIDDVTRQIDPQSFDPNLKPEESTDITLLARRSFGPLQLTGSVFYQEIDNAIFSFSGLNQFGTVISNFKNIDLVRQSGIELLGETRDLFALGLDIDANVSYIDAKTVRNLANPSAQGVRFPRVPEWRASGNVRYKIGSDLKASLGWRYASRPNSDLFGLIRGDAFGFQSEYFYVDTRLSWDLNDKVQISAGVDNINNDQGYVFHPMPQRTFVFDVKLKL
jgi:iron complex outermembrane receptor protein